MKTRYADLSRDSGVTHYDLGDDWIAVWFRNEPEKPYRYPRARIGAAHLREMQRLAAAGRGLSGYISSHPEVRNGFER